MAIHLNAQREEMSPFKSLSWAVTYRSLLSGEKVGINVAGSECGAKSQCNFLSKSRLVMFFSIFHSRCGYRLLTALVCD